MTNSTFEASGSSLLSRDIDDLLLHLRGLVLVRDLLAERGATRSELDAHSNELERLRHRLAGMIGGQVATAPAERLWTDVSRPPAFGGPLASGRTA
jgi:hypothetical protein